MTRLRTFALAAAIAASTIGCESNDTPTTPTTGTGDTSFTLVFSGTISPGASRSFAFTLIGGAPLRITLGSLTDANEVPLSASMRITFGRPAGTGCGALEGVTTGPSLGTQMHIFASAGTYCVAIADVGQLSGEATFGVRITQGDPTIVGGAGTVTYASTLLPGGATSRTFDASTAGTVTVILDTIDQPAVPALGVGLGFPRADGGGCQLTTSVLASRGTQFSYSVDIGTYCVRVTDPGTLTGVTGFSLRIQHP